MMRLTASPGFDHIAARSGTNDAQKNKMSKVLITGANGFVGKRTCEIFSDRAIAHAAAVRRKTSDGQVEVGTIDGGTDWTLALSGCDAVIHLAARVHVMADEATTALEKFRKTNVDGTLNLARQAARSGVRRFVFVSSVKVNGEETAGKPFVETDVPGPCDPYGISKYEAELRLLELAAETGLEVAIVRPPLVYGPGVKANFESMLRWVYRGVPLPFGAIQNKRSVVYVDNLASLLIRCVEAPQASNQVFMVSDGQDISTSQLLCRCAGALGVPSRLLPVPQAVLSLLAAMTGKQPFMRRLCGSLQVDIGKARRMLDWEPPVSMELGLRLTAEAFLKKRDIL